MKKHLAKTTLLLIIASVVLALALAAYFFLYQEIANTKADIADLSNTLGNDKARNDDLDAIKSNIVATIADHDKITSLFVEDDAVADFIQNIESIAKASGLGVETQTVESEPSPELASFHKELLSETLHTDGSWQDTLQFVGLLSNLPYKLSLTSLSLTNIPVSQAGTLSEKQKKSSGNVWDAVYSFTVVKTVASSTVSQ